MAHLPSLGLFHIFPLQLSVCSGFRTSRRPPEFHRLLDSMSPANLVRTVCSGETISIITAAHFSKVGRLLQNMWKPQLYGSLISISRNMRHISSTKQIKLMLIANTNYVKAWKQKLLSLVKSNTSISQSSH